MGEVEWLGWFEDELNVVGVFEGVIEGLERRGEEERGFFRLKGVCEI